MPPSSQDVEISEFSKPPEALPATSASQLPAEAAGPESPGAAPAAGACPVGCDAGAKAFASPSRWLPPVPKPRSAASESGRRRGALAMASLERAG